MRVLKIFLCSWFLLPLQIGVAQAPVIPYPVLRQLDSPVHPISVGGSFRFQAESFTNEKFLDVSPQDNLWFLGRLLLHANVHMGNKMQVFLELNSSLVAGKENIAPVDKDIFSINQVFIAFKPWEKLQIRLGRENLMLGGRRLVDIREGPNVRRSFDMGLASWKSRNTAIMGFFALPVSNRPGALDNDFLEFRETFSGLYFTQYSREGINLDTYVFYQKEDDVLYSTGAGNERRISFGGRLFGSTRNLGYDLELVYQTGRFSEMTISAYTLSIQAAWGFHVQDYEGRAGFKTELIEGDRNAADSRLNTFDPYYPRGAYFGRVARFGPSNLMDFHPYINFTGKAWYMELDYDGFWRYSTRDGIYDPAMNLAYPDQNDQRFVAHQYGVILGIVLCRSFNLEMEANYISPGNFLKNSGLNKPLFNWVLTAEYKF